MENTLPMPEGGITEVKTAGSVLYVHGRRVIITLIVILLIIGIFGVLYYNGKVVYEKGL